MVRVWQLCWSSFHNWAPIILTVCSGRDGAHLEAHFSVISLIVVFHTEKYMQALNQAWWYEAEHGDIGMECRWRLQAIFDRFPYQA